MDEAVNRLAPGLPMLDGGRIEKGVFEPCRKFSRTS